MPSFPFNFKWKNWGALPAAKDRQKSCYSNIRRGEVNYGLAFPLIH
ncbi:MAG TPA: hypothetical protein VJ873_08100 [bacterium]|nr:hypothetical protein [bacterium]